MSFFPFFLYLSFVYTMWTVGVRLVYKYIPKPNIKAFRFSYRFGRFFYILYVLDGDDIKVHVLDVNIWFSFFKGFLFFSVDWMYLLYYGDVYIYYHTFIYREKEHNGTQFFFFSSFYSSTQRIFIFFFIWAVLCALVHSETDSDVNWILLLA